LGKRIFTRPFSLNVSHQKLADYNSAQLTIQFEDPGIMWSYVFSFKFLQ